MLAEFPGVRQNFLFYQRVSCSLKMIARSVTDFVLAPKAIEKKTRFNY